MSCTATLAPSAAGTAAPVPGLRLVDLVDDLPGLPRQRAFVRVPTGAGPLEWLQSLDPRGPRFLVAPGSCYVPGYAPRLPGAVLMEIEADGTVLPELLCLVAVPDGDTSRATINLRAPIVVNPVNGHARQVVLADGGYAIRHPLRR